LAIAGCGRVAFDPSSRGDASGDLDGAGDVSACTGATPRYQQGKCGELFSVPAPNLTVTLDSPITAGNLLVIAADYDAPTATPVVTDTLGTTFTKVVGPTLSTQQASAVWIAEATASGADSVTIDLGQVTGGMGLYVHEYSPGHVVITSTATGSSNTPTTPPLITAIADHTLFAHAVIRTSITGVQPSFQPLQTCNANMTANADAPTPGTYQARFGATAAAEWIATIVELSACP
jgi:hypothetical protein